jgi:hypothetical protein
MPTWLTVVLVALVVLALVLLGAGLLWNRRFLARTRGDLLQRVAAADNALALAVAGDRGWDRARMEAAATAAFAAAQPGLTPVDLHLVLVDDRPGTDQDRAVFEATFAGAPREVTIVRRGDEWLPATPPAPAAT